MRPVCYLQCIPHYLCCISRYVVFQADYIFLSPTPPNPSDCVQIATILRFSVVAWFGGGGAVCVCECGVWVLGFFFCFVLFFN